MPTLMLTMATKGATLPPVPYHRVRVKLYSTGDKVHTFALHKNANGHWQISDIRSGFRVMVIQGQYKGIRASTNGYTAADIRRIAPGQLAELALRIGEEKFLATIAAAPAIAQPA